MFGKTEALFTDAILSALHALEEAPWKDLNGKGLDSRGLALRLCAYPDQGLLIIPALTSSLALFYEAPSRYDASHAAL